MKDDQKAGILIAILLWLLWRNPSGTATTVITTPGIIPQDGAIAFDSNGNKQCYNAAFNSWYPC